MMLTRRDEDLSSLKLMHSHRGTENQEPAGMRTSLSNNIALDLPSSTTALDDNTAAPLALSPRLHNKDLAPTKA